MKKMKILIILMVILTVFLSSCGKNEVADDTAELTSIRDLVHDYSIGNIKGESASITSSELIITKEDGKKVAIDISKEDFFVSIAPYIKETHPCQNHSLTGCRGELPNKEFHVLIEDAKGNIVIDENLTSLPNGFIDLWLPRNKTYNITIEYDGLVAKGKISTSYGSNTCITTLQLQ